MDERFIFDEASYDALAANGMPWQTVLAVLRDGRPRLRRHTGAVLQIAARSPDGAWVGVVLVETTDDEYLVVSARELDQVEAEAIEKMLGDQ